jgi:hypothetical protein
LDFLVSALIAKQFPYPYLMVVVFWVRKKSLKQQEEYIKDGFSLCDIYFLVNC